MISLEFSLTQPMMQRRSIKQTVLLNRLHVLVHNDCNLIC